MILPLTQSFSKQDVVAQKQVNLFGEFPFAISTLALSFLADECSKYFRLLFHPQCACLRQVHPGTHGRIYRFANARVVPFLRFRDELQRIP
jgi:hypothetical protein